MATQNRRWVTVVFFCLCIVGILGTSEKEDMIYQRKWMEMEYKIHTNPEFKARWDKQMQNWPRFDEIDDVPTVDCDVVTSPEIPTSVHQLRPSDIKVMAAMGDGITAGNGLGAQNFYGAVFQNRGESWCVGGDLSMNEQVFTIPNILKHFNPDLKGFSTCWAFRGSRRAGLNVARRQATNTYITEQAEELVVKMATDWQAGRIDYHKDWKMITILLGGEDLCNYCEDKNAYGPEKYLENLGKALDILQHQIPRAFVNLVAMYDISPLADMGISAIPGNDVFCSMMHRRLCPCINRNTNRTELKEVQLAYYEGLREQVASGRWDKREDFTVVFQPHMRDFVPIYNSTTGELDRHYFTFDCLRPSRLGHHDMTYMLWNTMFVGVGDKPTNVSLPPPRVRKLSCPTEDNPYLFTNRNSPNGPTPPPTTTAPPTAPPIQTTLPTDSAWMVTASASYLVITIGVFMSRFA